jgi:hypothetical protein
MDCQSGAQAQADDDNRRGNNCWYHFLSRGAWQAKFKIEDSLSRSVCLSVRLPPKKKKKGGIELDGHGTELLYVYPRSMGYGYRIPGPRSRVRLCYLQPQRVAMVTRWCRLQRERRKRGSEGRSGVATFRFRPGESGMDGKISACLDARYRQVGTVHRYRTIGDDAESVRALNVVQKQRAQAACLGNKEEMEIEPCRRNCLAEIGTLGYAHGNLCSAYPTRCCVHRSMKETILCAYAGR